VFQIYAPGGQINPVTNQFSSGLLNVAGTPNLLRDMSLDCYQAQWIDQMQGGLDKAQFDFRFPYESSFDIISGNWVIFGCLGAQLRTTGHPGDTTLSLSGLSNQQIPRIWDPVGQQWSKNLDLTHNDLVLLSDGTNAELFKVAGISGNGPWTVTLSPAWANVQVFQECLLVTDAAEGASSVKVNRKGGLSNGINIVIGSDKYHLNTIGGPDGNGNFTLNLNTTLSGNYSRGTPVAMSASGNSVIRVTTTAGVPGGATVWFDEGRPNAEKGVISSKTATTITLTNPLNNSHGAGSPIIFQMSSQLQNTYAAGSYLVRVQYQGYISKRVHDTKILEQLSIACDGFFSRYNYLIDSSVITKQPSGMIVKRALGSYGATIPGIIVNDTTPDLYLAINTAVKVNASVTDSPFSQFLDTVLRQENGNSTHVQYAIWVDHDRIVRHLPIATSPAYGKLNNTPTYFLSLSDGSSGATGGGYGDTVDSVQTSDMDMSSLMNAAVVTGATAPSGSGITNANETTCAQTLPNGGTSLVVTSVPSGWPQSGGGLRIFVNRKNTPPQFTSYSGTTVHTAGGYGKDVNVGDKIEMVTNLTGSHSPGDQNFTVGNAHLFSSGQEITITPTGATEESLTIQTIDYGSNKITTTTACKKAHGSSDIVLLANNGNGQGARILVEQLDSIYGGVDVNGNKYGGFGWFEGTLSSQDIYDESALSQWAARQLSVLAWPAQASQVILSTTSGRLSGRDLVSITGFAQGTPDMVQNVQSVQYNMTAADMNVSATVHLTTLRSTAQGVISQMAKEHVHRVKYSYTRHNDNKNMVSHGHKISQTDVNQVTISAGTVNYNGLTSQLAEATFVCPEGESRFGANVGPGITPTIVELPKRNWNGRSVYSHSGVYTIDQIGDVPQLSSTFSGIPLWKVLVADGNVVGWEPLFTQRGTSLENLPSNASVPAPIVTGFGGVTTTLGNQISADVEISGTITNFPTDGSCAEYKIYTRTTGNPGWALQHTFRVVGLPQPQNNFILDCVLHALPRGVNIDFGMSFDGFNGEGPIATLQTGYVLPGIPSFFNYITVSAVVPSGVGGGANPVPFGPGALAIYNQTGAGLNAKLYVYDEVVGWQPVSLVGST
jgi:hypothetical protein